MDRAPTVRDELIRGLLAYLEANPNACDTLDGISQRWLRDLTADFVSLEEALGELVLRGMLVTKSLPDGRLLYSASK